MEDLVATYLHISGKFFPSHLRNSSLSVEIRFVSNLEIGIFASMKHAAGLHNLPHPCIWDARKQKVNGKMKRKWGKE